jgi:predicted AAA+ superfamily ATPase
MVRSDGGSFVTSAVWTCCRGGRDDKATACREGARPEIVIEVAKRRGREERRREELARYVSNIFEKLSAKKLQKHLVSAGRFLRGGRTSVGWRV